MSEPFLAEIRIFGFTFPPRGWAFCDGQILSIQQNTALFALLGTYYGGNGQTTFALPNFQGTVPMHWGNGAGLSPYVIGETIGSPTVNLLQSEMPMHNHAIETAIPNKGQGTGTPGPTTWLGGSSPDKLYSDQAPSPTTMFSPRAIWVTGGSQPHENMQPYLVLNFCIALEGIFPARN